jgi:hypothetical protein
MAALESTNSLPSAVKDIAGEVAVLLKKQGATISVAETVCFYQSDSRLSTAIALTTFRSRGPEADGLATQTLTI